MATDRCDNLDSISEYNRNRLRDWNREIPPLVNSLVHKQIEIQAECHPRNEAVCAWNGTLTYEELNERANTLANNLTAAGVQVGDYVPLLFEKSKWYIVSILAVSSSEGLPLRTVLTSVAIALGAQSWGCICPARTDNARRAYPDSPRADRENTAHPSFTKPVSQIRKLGAQDHRCR